MSQIKFLLQACALFAFCLAAANGQTQDNSGNSLLNGSFRFRHVAVQNVDVFSNPTEVTATFGTITFDGAGNYSLAGTSVDNTVGTGTPAPLNTTGTYAIGANGLGYIANPLYPTDTNDYIYGAVSQGIFTGSATEAVLDGFTLNDVFIAIPSSTTPTNAGFVSSYQTGVLDFTGAGVTVRNALFKLVPDGKGGFGTINLNGQASDQTNTSLTQSITGATYNFGTDGTAALTIPLPTGVTLANALFTGPKSLVVSADGNFILGWTPGGYDLFFGVKTLAVSGTNALTAGLYFTAGLEDSFNTSGTDSFYGSTNNLGNITGDGIVHQRVNTPTGLSFDYGADNEIGVNADGTTPTDFNGYRYIFGDGGLAFVGIGTNGFFSLQVGTHASAFSGTGVWLNPIGVVNAGSWQPITASLAPGELIALFGSGLSSTTIVTPGKQPFPLSLGGVSVTIDGLACPVYYVTPTQLSVTVPYGVALNQTGLANIQVNNNGIVSNIVQMYISDSTPGSFSQNANGIGYAAAAHAATGQLITPTNPAVGGEYVSFYLTGLGPVTPTVSDGAVGPSPSLSWSDLYNAGNLSVYFNDYGSSGTTGNAGTIQFAGLAPTLGGLYQINVQVPTSGLAAGDDVYVEFVTDAADIDQIKIRYGTTAGLATPAPGAPVANQRSQKLLQRAIRARAASH